MSNKIKKHEENYLHISKERLGIFLLGLALTYCSIGMFKFMDEFFNIAEFGFFVFGPVLSLATITLLAFLCLITAFKPDN